MGLFSKLAAVATGGIAALSFAATGVAAKKAGLFKGKKSADEREIARLRGLRRRATGIFGAELKRVGKIDVAARGRQAREAARFGISQQQRGLVSAQQQSQRDISRQLARRGTGISSLSFTSGAAAARPFQQQAAFLQAQTPLLLQQAQQQGVRTAAQERLGGAQAFLGSGLAPQFKPGQASLFSRVAPTVAGLAGAGLGAFFGGPVGASVGGTLGQTAGKKISLVSGAAQIPGTVR